MKILVTGGAGYIGSVTVKSLLRKGHSVTVYDNLSQGKREFVTTDFIQGDLLDKEMLFKCFKDGNFEAVIHFAAKALAGESMKNPFLYFQNNVLGGLNLLEAMKTHGVGYIVFSSTCALYGTPKALPVNENEEKKPESVYGESKLMVEQLLYWYNQIYSIKYMNLRYFNAAGAALDGSSGEQHDPETHIIPLAIKSALNNSSFTIYGKNYNTPDGTCIRDYIHVEDLAQAHLLALSYLAKTGNSDSCNLGTGTGYSNIQVIEEIKKITKVDFPVLFSERRAGDPAVIYADNAKAKKLLGFEPRYSDLSTIVETAWKWHSRNFLVL